MTDPLYDKAVEAVLKSLDPSVSLVQRRLKLGYAQALCLMERMEKAGLVSSPNASGKRQILLPAYASPKPEPLQAVYLYNQANAGWLKRHRAWYGWLSDGGTRDVECELIAVDEKDTALASLHSSGREWDVLIYEPSGYPSPEARP